ncbi:MFS transporter [Devosia nitrariae]|uniref:MFS transporter n=1 Tax=Devosia nitrariae TaxID=2071872 RepID=A0ABQ5VZY0_9HYPH|nr:MFS transporter [Devosia nitrariae]GLQ53372.1 MFS transporter [Devosia nitrariae]
MSNPYSEIFRAPGAKGFAAAGFLARLPIAMTTMGIVAMLSQTHGEYWLAGAVSATFALTNAFVSPQISRLVDRLGQSRVLVPTTVVAVAAFAALLAATYYRWPTWTLFATAVLAGVMPSMPAMVRARWTELYRDKPLLGTAFAFESVADELVYIVGSVLSVGLSVTLFPEAGVLVSTISLTVGTALFVIQKSTEPRVQPAARSKGRSAIALRPVQIVALTLIAVGAIFGTAEVTVIALTETWGSPASASLVLGSYAVGSFLVGIVYGALKLNMALSRQFLIAVAIVAVATIPLLFVPNVPLLALLLLTSGLAISPTFITAFGLIERLVPAAKLTEGMTWAVTGIAIGMAIGSFTSGWVVDQFGAGNGFWVSVTAGVVAVLVALVGQASLSGSRQAATPELATA